MVDQKRFSAKFLTVSILMLSGPAMCKNCISSLDGSSFVHSKSRPKSGELKCKKYFRFFPKYELKRRLFLLYPFSATETTKSTIFSCIARSLALFGGYLYLYSNSKVKSSLWDTPYFGKILLCDYVQSYNGIYYYIII